MNSLGGMALRFLGIAEINSSGCSPCSAVVLAPDAHKLIQVMGAQDGGVSCEVLKVIHDDRHKQIQHLRGRHMEEIMDGNDLTLLYLT